MNDRDIRRYERATRVLTFGTSNDADFAPCSLARVHFGNITAQLAQLAQLALAKAGQAPARVSKETLLDTIMRNKYDLQPEKLHAWESLSRVERAPVRAKKDKPAPVPRPSPS